MNTMTQTEHQTHQAFDTGEIVLRIRSLPGQPVEGVYRLRRLLKCMLRSFGFKCLEVLPAAEEFGVTVDDR